MSAALSELCKNLQENTNQLEEELKRNIASCHKLLIDRKATEIKLSLEKAKDYHYKEILNILKDIVNNLRKIILHEEKIRTLDSEKNFSPDELKRYSYVQRQVQVFSTAGEVTKREKRRVASEISVDSLQAWELYLEKKDEDKSFGMETVNIPKRKGTSTRRKKKFVSSTFNNFLDGKKENGMLHSISEDDQLNLMDEMARCEMKDNYIEKYNSQPSLTSLNESNNVDEDCKDQCIKGLSPRQTLSTSDLVESFNAEHNLNISSNKTKPIIVDVIYKKNDNWSKKKGGRK